MLELIVPFNISHGPGLKGDDLQFQREVMILAYIISLALA